MPLHLSSEKLKIRVWNLHKIRGGRGRGGRGGLLKKKKKLYHMFLPPGRRENKFERTSGRTSSGSLKRGDAACGTAHCTVACTPSTVTFHTAPSRGTHEGRNHCCHPKFATRYRTLPYMPYRLVKLLPARRFAMVFSCGTATYIPYNHVPHHTYTAPFHSTLPIRNFGRKKWLS